MYPHVTQIGARPAMAAELAGQEPPPPRRRLRLKVRSIRLLRGAA